MEVILATFEIKPDKTGEFEALGRELVAATHKEPGCLLYRLHKSGERTYIFYEAYVDADAVKAHMAGPALRELFPKVQALLASPPRIERPAVIAG
ncbi:MAG: antibiotic biosynthesis monooxygenase [Deltaproteobacteria bacterium]|nr:antibiotic biosynthesis monooxygenase [Deltaproteobacteria bacterium]